MSDRAAPPACSADEIEVTPEMIRAGRDALYLFDIMHPTDPEMGRAVEAVFLAMIANNRSFRP